MTHCHISSTVFYFESHWFFEILISSLLCKVNHTKFESQILEYRTSINMKKLCQHFVDKFSNWIHASPFYKTLSTHLMNKLSCRNYRIDSNSQSSRGFEINSWFGVDPFYNVRFSGAVNLMYLYAQSVITIFFFVYANFKRNVKIIIFMLTQVLNWSIGNYCALIWRVDVNVTDTVYINEKPLSTTFAFNSVWIIYS